MHQLDKLFQRQNALFHKMRVACGKGRFQSDNAHGALFKTLGLFFMAVGRVVGDEHVDRAVQKPLDERVLIGLIAQRGIHLEASVLL